MRSLDPFEEIEPQDGECTLIDVLQAESTSEYENKHEMPDNDESSSEWEMRNDVIGRNAFDMFEK